MTIIGKAVEWVTKGREQVCEACASAFTCGPFTKSGCWCANEKLSADTRAQLKTRYKSCLCPECLKRQATA